MKTPTLAARLKTALKSPGAEVRVEFYKPSYVLTTNVIKARIRLKFELQSAYSDYREEKWLWFDARCNPLDEYNVKDKPMRNIHGYGGFYALHSDVNLYAFMSHSNESAELVAELYKIIQKTVDDKNLIYVWSGCELSQFVGALKTLGVKSEEWLFEKEPFNVWYQREAEKRRDAEAKAEQQAEVL